MFNYVWTTITKIFKSDDDDYHHTGDISKCPFMNSALASNDLKDKQSVDDHETKV